MSIKSRQDGFDSNYSSTVKLFFDQSYSSKSLTKKTYLCISPGDYQYLIFPSKQSLQWLADRFNGDSFRRKLGSAGVSFLSLAPISTHLLSFLPHIQRYNLNVPKSWKFDIAVIGGRIKLINFNEGNIVTLPTKSPNSIRREVEIRQKLPKSINTAKIYEYNSDFPWISEEYLEGKTLSAPIENKWGWIQKALDQLKKLHDNTATRMVSTETIRKDMSEVLAESELRGDQTINRALSLLEKHGLPEYLQQSRIHGDFQTGNILFSQNTIYLLDWESSRIDLTIYDLFAVFKRWSIEGKDAKPLSCLVNPTGTYQEITKAIGDRYGNVAYDESRYYDGLPIFYTLLELVQGSPNSPHADHFAYDLLRDLIEDLT